MRKFHAFSCALDLEWNSFSFQQLQIQAQKWWNSDQNKRKEGLHSYKNHTPNELNNNLIIFHILFSQAKTTITINTTTQLLIAYVTMVTWAISSLLNWYCSCLISFMDVKLAWNWLEQHPEGRHICMRRVAAGCMQNGGGRCRRKNVEGWIESCSYWG